MAIFSKQMGKGNLPDWRRDEALRDAQWRLAEAERAAPGLEHAVEVARRQVASAEAARDDVAALAMIGRATAQELAAAQAQLDQAKKAGAQAAFDLKECQRQQALLAPGVQQLEFEAKLAARDAFQALHKPLVERLEAALVALGEANTALEQLHDTAYGQFGGPPAEKDVAHFPTAAGTPSVWRRDFVPRPGSAYDAWLKDIRSYLHPAG